MDKRISIAVDGPAGAGKSSLSKRIASALGFVYVDTGAIYRTVAVACKRAGVDAAAADDVSEHLRDISIDIRYDEDGLQMMILNGDDVTTEIRQPDISMLASAVSALPCVRAFLLDMQREFARKYSVIMDGRDIGTVVLPDADVKIYLTASVEARAQRRILELREKGIETTLEEVTRDIEQRDWQDTHREIAPLKKADDAVVADTSDLSFDESFNLLLRIIEEKTGVTA